MQGTHYVAHGEPNLDYSSQQIVKDFMGCEEGFLSSKYTDVLKKYYTVDFAEKLYVFHGMLLKAIAVRKFTSTHENMMRPTQSTDTWAKAIKEGLFFSFAAHAKDIDDLERAKIESGDGVSVDRPRTLVEMGPTVNVIDIGEASCMYFRQPQITPAEAAVPSALMGNVFGLASRRCSTWLPTCTHNWDHMTTIRNKSSANALQAFFHMRDVSGYDGSRTLEELYSRECS